MEKEERKNRLTMYAAIAVALISICYTSCDAKKNAASNEAPAQQTSTVANTENVEVKNAVTAKKLSAAYAANEVAADNDYKEKTLYVTGTVTQIGKDLTDDIYVTLAGHDEISEVQCYFADKDVAAKLRKGQTVTFKGECGGLVMNVLMKDCVLAD